MDFGIFLLLQSPTAESPADVFARGVGIGRLVAGLDDDSDLFDTGRNDLFDDDLQGSLLLSVQVNKAL